MNTLTNCQNCGQPLAADVSQGLCPACLMKIGLGIGTCAGSATEPSGTGPAAAFVPPTPEHLQRLLPQFDVLGMIGRGGMGAVYRARQKSLDRLVALKILAKRGDQDPKFNERFALEARTLARLSHPNIISVFDFGEVEGLCYLVMEHVDGVNLRQMLQAQKMAPKEALAIVPDLCAALQYAHDQGIVHRDIKPENILIDRQGRVKIADFGLAKLLGTEAPAIGSADAAASVVPPSGGFRALDPDRLKPGLQAPLTAAGKVMGTPHYMAPEQIEHPQTVDHRADIFSLGVVFYEMLTGELPVGKFAPPSFKVQIDVRLDEVVLRTLEKEPQRRYQQASQVNTALETIANQPSPVSKDLSKAPASSDSPVRSPNIANIDPDAAVGSSELPPEAQAVKARLRFTSLILLALGLATYGTFFIEILAASILPENAARSLLQFYYRLVNGIPRDLQMLDLGRLGHLLGPLALVAAWQLRKGRGFTLANLAIVGSFFQVGSLLWTVPLGIFGLRQLWRKDVRAAFAAVEKQSRDNGSRREECQDNYLLAIGSAGLVLVSMLSLPLFVEGSQDVGFQRGLVSVAFHGARWLPHLAQGAGIVLGTLALLAMPKLGGRAKGLGWALLGTLFPLLVCLAGCWSANRWTHTPVPYPVFSPYDLEPRAEQYLWQGLWATLAAGFVAGWAVYRKVKNLRLGNEMAVLRMLHGIRWTIGIMVVAYAVIGMAKFYSVNPNWQSHLANLAQVVLVAAGVGWLASRSHQRSSRNSARVILRRVKWVSWSVGMLALAYMGIYLVSFQYRRMLDNAQGLAFNVAEQFFDKHAHAQAPSGSEVKAVTARSVSGSIELTTISEPAASNVVCWLPDGTIRCAEKPPLSQPAASRAERRTLVFGLAGYGQTTNLANLHWECWGTIAGVERICPVSQLYLNGNRQGRICATFPGDAQTAHLRVGIPKPTWEDTDAVWLWTGAQREFRKKSIRRGGEDWEFRLERVETDKGLSVTFTSQIKRDSEARLIAVDAEGTIHEPVYSSGGPSCAYFPELLGRTMYDQVRFGGLDVTQLKELRFQVRPFRWVEFQNISLRPGQRTQVEVRESGAAASDNSQSTRPSNP